MLTFLSNQNKEKTLNYSFFEESVNSLAILIHESLNYTTAMFQGVSQLWELSQMLKDYGQLRLNQFR